MSDDHDASETKTGLSAALDGVDPGAPPADDADQLDLLASDPETPLGPSIGDLAAGPRGPGRPKGSRNKRTEEWQSFLLAKHRSPLEVLAEAYSRPVQELAAQLGCSPHEAFKLQIAAAKELAPYVHQKMPTAVALNGVPMAPISIVVDPDLAAQVGITLDPETVDIPDAEIVENQDVTEAVDGKSNGEKSNEGD